jgi:hypothetical protein
MSYQQQNMVDVTDQPFDEHLPAPDPVYDAVLSRAAEVRPNVATSVCGHPRRYRYQRSNGCLVCDVVGLLETERPPQHRNRSSLPGE